MLTVVAALIQHEGKLLVCQRRRGSRFELQWEFPGGKREDGETLPGALARELQEELGVTAQIGPELHRLHHQYPSTGVPFELVFFAASAPADQIQNREFERIEWRRPEELPELDFLEADRDLVARLASGAIRADWAG
ncbi:MAG TPA: (deoxy)nucleoside triphosphate pyrophosphohydrolase [Candidatus Aquilonibacter sp.]|nr:(deoxy)nucleoside triphosphate pyrophosphohydrolase [Candidatus Aquilonibacter sp.]